LDPLRITGEITDWQGHPPEQLQAMKDAITGIDPLEGS
jgi:rifampin ADP-ribosylating transferase